MSEDDGIIVIDPMNEYFDLTDTYGGTVVNMSTYTDNYVNPLEMDVWSLEPNDSKRMVREKAEFMLGLCEQCIGDSLNIGLLRMGLIKCGSVVIPFDNQISKDTDLYSLYNTNIREKIAMMKKEKHK